MQSIVTSMKTATTSVSANRRRKRAAIKKNAKGGTLRRMPRLDTIRMVEAALRGSRTFTSKNQLWRSLPKQVQYPTFMTILEYLEESNKIVYAKDGSIVWTFMDSSNLAARKSLERALPL